GINLVHDRTNRQRTEHHLNPVIPRNAQPRRHTKGQQLPATLGQGESDPRTAAGENVAFWLRDPAPVRLERPAVGAECTKTDRARHARRGRRGARPLTVGGGSARWSRRPVRERSQRSARYAAPPMPSLLFPPTGRSSLRPFPC